ncbi:MAG: hypothetical protein ABJ308_10345 [Halieaceae bacterium]
MIEHTVVTARNYAYITVKGSPDLAQFIRAARIFVKDPQYSADLKRICDFSQSDLSHVKFDEFMRFLDFAMQEITLAPNTRVALVAPDPGRSGIFEQFANNIESGDFQIFFDPVSAVEWIQS